MKKWRMIWGAVILTGMLGGCQRDVTGWKKLEEGETDAK